MVVLRQPLTLLALAQNTVTIGLIPEGGAEYFFLLWPRLRKLVTQPNECNTPEWTRVIIHVECRVTRLDDRGLAQLLLTYYQFQMGVPSPWNGFGGLYIRHQEIKFSHSLSLPPSDPGSLTS